MGGPVLGRRSVMLGGAGALLASACATRAPAGPPLAAGTGVFTFTRWGGPPLQVHTYRPALVTARTPVVVVMHGASRNANTYRDNWVREAEARGLIIASPEFDKARFPESPPYALGGLSDDDERFRPNPTAAFTAIEPMFDELRARTETRVPTYRIFGHSAGGQFVHRYTLQTATPRAEVLIAANSGWYTAATLRTPYPYGLGGTGLTEADLRRAFAKPLIVLLGTADLDRSNDNFRKSPEADAQGRSRFERGQWFFAQARAEAARLRAPFRWRLEFAPGVAHENGELAPIAAALMFGPAGASRA